MRKIFKFFTDFSKLGNFNRISLFQITSQYIAGFISFILIIIGSLYFAKSLYSFVIPFHNNKHEFYILIKGILSSFELFFMAPIPFLVIFSHKRNINQAFSEILPVQQRAFLALDEIKAKKGFISSIIGILATFILGVFFEFFSKDTENRFKLFDTNFSYCLIIICMLFLFLTILIYYYKLLSNHEDKNG